MPFEVKEVGGKDSTQCLVSVKYVVEKRQIVQNESDRKQVAAILRKQIIEEIKNELGGELNESD